MLSIEAPPFASSNPDTVRLSVTLTVPPAESIVRLPVDVSISFAFVTPMRILPPMFAPAVNVPLTTRYHQSLLCHQQSQ